MRAFGQTRTPFLLGTFELSDSVQVAVIGRECAGTSPGAPHSSTVPEAPSTKTAAFSRLKTKSCRRFSRPSPALCSGGSRSSSQRILPRNCPMIANGPFFGRAPACTSPMPSH